MPNDSGPPDGLPSQVPHAPCASQEDKAEVCNTGRYLDFRNIKFVDEALTDSRSLKGRKEEATIDLYQTTESGKGMSS